MQILILRICVVVFNCFLLQNDQFTHRIVNSSCSCLACYPVGFRIETDLCRVWAALPGGGEGAHMTLSNSTGINSGGVAGVDEYHQVVNNYCLIGLLLLSILELRKTKIA